VSALQDKIIIQGDELEAEETLIIVIKMVNLLP